MRYRVGLIVTGQGPVVEMDPTAFHRFAILTQDVDFEKTSRDVAAVETCGGPDKRQLFPGKPDSPDTRFPESAVRARDVLPEP